MLQEGSPELAHPTTSLDVAPLEPSTALFRVGGFPKLGVPHCFGVYMGVPHFVETTIYAEALAGACQNFSSGENPGISVGFESEILSFWRVVGHACGRADHNETKFVNSEKVL